MVLERVQMLQGLLRHASFDFVLAVRQPDFTNALSTRIIKVKRRVADDIRFAEAEHARPLLTRCNDVDDLQHDKEVRLSGAELLDRAGWRQVLRDERLVEERRPQTRADS